MKARVAAGGLALALAAGPARAAPDDGDLVLAGLAMAPPTYVLGVLWHEGSHALAAKAMGAEVTDFSILPGRSPRTGAFHFGLTSVRGLPTCASARALFFGVPKLVDLALLGGFAALLHAGDGAAWPDDAYAQLGLTVLATGAWVDFAKDVVVFSRHNDVVKLMSIAGLDTELGRLPVRLAYLAANVGLALVVWEGYRRAFASAGGDAPRIAPLFAARF